jgi:hypothetical protein
MRNTPTHPDPREELPPGTPVYAVNGEPVGQVTHSALHAGYFVLEKHWPFAHAVCLSARLIERREPKGITLSRSKGELRQSRWQVTSAARLLNDSIPPRWPPSRAERGGDTTDTGGSPLPPAEDEPPLTPC